MPDRSTAEQPAEPIPDADSRNAQRELASLQQAVVSHSEKLADARQDLTSLRSRQTRLFDCQLMQHGEPGHLRGAEITRCIVGLENEARTP